MARKKYKLTELTEIDKGHKLFRIEALRTIHTRSGLVVKKGELGGWVENESNLSQEGNCWIFPGCMCFDNAKVTEDAYLQGFAMVSGNAHVFGQAEVSGNAKVSGDAMVFCNAEVGFNAVVEGNARVFDRAHVGGNAYVGEQATIAGNANIHGMAKVVGRAIVQDQAAIAGSALVTGRAVIKSDVRVYGEAQIGKKGNYLALYGEAYISQNAEIDVSNHVFCASGVGSQCRTLTMYRTKGGGITVDRGCFEGSVQDFLKRSAKEHDERTQLEYLMLIEVGISRITRNVYGK